MRVSALDASEHCEGYELSRCSDDPTQHVVRIEWDSEEGHRRGSFINDIDELRHYHVTFASER